MHPATPCLLVSLSFRSEKQRAVGWDPGRGGHGGCGGGGSGSGGLVQDGRGQRIAWGPARLHCSNAPLVLNILRLKGLLRLEAEEEGGRAILLAVAEAEGGTLEDLRGEMEPGPGTAGFILLKGCDGDLVCIFMSSSLRAPVVAERGCLRPFKARSLSP